MRFPRFGRSCSLCVDGGRLTRVGDAPCARSNRERHAHPVICPRVPHRQRRPSELEASHHEGRGGRGRRSVSCMRSGEPIRPQPLSPSPGRSAGLHLANNAEHQSPTLLLLQPMLLPAHLRRAGIRSPCAMGPADASAGRNARAGRHHLRRRSRRAAPDAPAHAGEPCHGAAPGQGHADAGRADPIHVGVDETQRAELPSSTARTIRDRKS